ncbi:saccharopine dehydrogenase family protein [Dietzia sp.]|uniref:saccharopine dehydrogenase family protein n=1 Tax=Dietzia sp. TaxID=1871616 RepID=UPI002FDA39E9
MDSTAAAREFDVIVFGATGFVGALTAAYLAENAPAGTKIALAGRNGAKLEAARAELPAAAREWPLVLADADDEAQLSAMARRARVVCTTVGPYLRYGRALATACAAEGTDYVDLTGEVPFVHWSIEANAEAAKASGARIVHSCGFDSVPSELGAYLVHREVEKAGAGSMGATTMVVRSMRGGASGGTIDSMRVVAEEASDPATRRILGNPQALSFDPGSDVPRPTAKQPGDMSTLAASSVDPSLSGRLAPFFMSSYNTRVVRRSSYLLGNAYGPDFRYGEAMAVGSNPVLSRVVAAGVAGGTIAAFGIMAVQPLRPIVDRLLPKPGSGPSEEARDNGHFTTETFTRTSTGRRFSARIHAEGDPGYKATAVMLGESALALALDRERLPERAGVLTASTAMGDVLVDRLRAADFEIEVRELG